MAGVARSAAGDAARTQVNAKRILESPEFKALVRKRWSISLGLLVALFVTYYGFVLLIGLNRAFVTQKIGEVTTLAIPLGVAVIAVAWGLTAFYVSWANKKYDPEVERLKALVERQ